MEYLRFQTKNNRIQEDFLPCSTFMSKIKHLDDIKADFEQTFSKTIIFFYNEQSEKL